MENLVESAPPHESLVNRLGVFQIAFVVIAFSAPLAVIASSIAVVISLGNQLGAAMSFALTGGVLLIFSVGFCEMVKALPNSGGFYVYITAGLGRPFGLGATFVALLSYFVLTAGSYTLFGLFTSRFVSERLGGPHLEWWVYVLVAWVVNTILAYRELSASAKLLTVSILLELILILAFDGRVLLHGGANGLITTPFTWSAFTSGVPGLGLLLAVTNYLGFESTAIYRNEARQPEKTIPRATFLAVTAMLLIYATTAYCVIVSYGSNVVNLVSADPSRAFPDAVQVELGRPVVTLCYLLVCTSVYGAVLSMHNVLARYVFKLATDGVFPAALGHTHPRFRSPSKASVVAAAGVVGFILPFVVFRANPTMLYVRLTGFGGFGLTTLIFITSIAVNVYLRKTKSRCGIMRGYVAPIIATIGLSVIILFANRNFSTLTGAPQGFALLIQGGIYVVLAAGIMYALWLRTHKPLVYMDLGKS